MNSSATQYKDVQSYFASAPKEVQSILKEIRETIQAAAPSAVESISYGMPAYKVNGKPIAYFAAFKKHVGFYATPSGHSAFATELSKYKQGKGSVQFPIDQNIPYTLIAKMVKFNVRNIKK